MTRYCQNCKITFEITEEDILFYDRIKVPPPTFCPDCRLQRRMSFFNTLKLYKRKCNLCGKEVVSRYSTDKSYKIYCPHCWWSDKWEAIEYGRDYDFSQPFFQQFYELWREVPLLGLSLDLPSAVESPYTNNAGHLKQCYLIFEADFDDRCLYGWYVVRSLDTAESSFVQSCERCYDLFHCYKSYQVLASAHTSFSNDSAFLWQCMSCQDCFGSANLRSKQYYFFNEPYGKDEYLAKVKELDLGSYRTYTSLKERVREHWARYPVKTFWNEFSTNTTGLFVFQSKNCKSCFEVFGAEDCKYVSFIQTPVVKDAYDYTIWGYNAELVYECMAAGENIRKVLFGEETGLNLYDAVYTKLCVGSSNLFGCVSLRNKSYCIFNKQYPKEEYENLISKIIKQMNEMPYVDKKGRIYKYGEFFPTEISPFAYNETIADFYYPLNKKQVLEKGFNWKEPEIGQHKITLPAKDLPDHIRDVSDSILQESVGCLLCGKAFRIIPQELEFYRKANVPLPRKCFYCRLDEKMKDQPHPMRLYQRKCQCAGRGTENGVYQNSAEHFHGNNYCPNEFETSYAADRPEIVYCEACYQSEVI